jgi:hypothetical protein
MKIEKIAFNDTAEMVVKHPCTGAELIGENDKPMTITVCGSQSRQFRDARNEQIDEGAGKPRDDINAAHHEQTSIELIASCTIKFNGLDLGDGLLDAKHAAEVYESNPWLYDQVDSFMGKKANFLAGPKKR